MTKINRRRASNAGAPIEEHPLISTIAKESNIQQRIKSILNNGVTTNDLRKILDNLAEANIFKQDEKLFKIENFLEGLYQAGSRQVGDYKLILQSLINKDNKFLDVVDALCYTTYKDRWQYFDIIFNAKYRGIQRQTPRGFASAELFTNFSREIRQLFSRLGFNDIRIQGSSTMDLPGELKDIDIAIVVNQQDYLQALKTVFGKHYYKFTTGKNPNTMPDGYTQNILDNDFLRFIETVKQDPYAEGITSEMRSAKLAWENGKLPDSKMLVNQERRIRDEIQDKYGLQGLDISLISEGRGFERGPFIQLVK